MTDIKDLIEARTATDPRLKAVLKKIKAGTATFKDTAYYSEIYSNITGSVFGANVLDLEGIEREEVCMELLRGNYEEINTICAQVQTALDQAAGIHIRPQKAAFPTDRVDQIAHSLLDPTVKDGVIKRRANTGVANVSQGFHDSYIKVNASFRNDSGLKVYINRETDGKCCEWCTKIAGRYSYGTEPDDIYRRHDNCGCTVTYENGKQRQDVWSKRSWTAPEVGSGAPPPTRFTPEQAAEIQARNMPQRLTNGQRNGIMDVDQGNHKIRFYNIHVDYEDTIYTEEEIEEQLQKSPVGRYISKCIEDDGYSVEMNYDTNVPLNLCGFVKGRHVSVNAINHSNSSEVAETIIHEVAHEKFSWVDTQEGEVNCRIYEYLHSHEAISEEKISEIVNEVREYYSYFPEGDLYGY